MRIVFVGVVENSRHCLKEVLRNDGHVVGIVTLARERAGFHADYADLSNIARQYKIPFHLTKNINDPESVELLRSLHPDVIFVFGWPQLVKRHVMDIPRFGCIGVHPTLLPKNRGRHPIIWSLVEGLDESGVTFFYLDEGADSGDILWQRSFPITLEDDAASIYEKVMSLESEAIREFLPQLEAGNGSRIPQDHSKATYWRKRTEEDGLINWAAPTMTTYNLIRALTRPYVGAHTYVTGEKLCIWRTRLPEGRLAPELQAAPEGTIIGKSSCDLDVRTGDGYLTVGDYELNGDGTLEVGSRLGAKE